MNLSIPNTLYNPNLEEIVLGACLIDSSGAKKAFGAITSDCFYSFKDLAALIEKMHSDGKAIDSITVFDEVRKKGLQIKPTEILEMTHKVGSAANIEYHCRILAQMAISRKLIEMCQFTVQEVLRGEDIFDVLENLQKGLTGSLPESNSNSFHVQDVKTKEVLEKTLKDGYKSIKFGLKCLNGSELELEYNQLVLLAAESSVGKTAFALNLMIMAANKNTKVGYFNFESSVMNLKRRILAMQTGISVSNIKRGKLTPSEKVELENAMIWLDQKEIYLNEKDSDILSLCNAIRKLHKIGVELFFVDNMSFVRFPEGDRLDIRIGEFLKPLAALRKELDICIVLIVHLSRDASGSPLKRLKNSSEYEQQGDHIIFLERNVLESEPEIKVFSAKNRDDELIEAQLNYNLQTQKISNKSDGSFTRYQEIDDLEF